MKVTPSARLSAAIDILEAIENSDKAANKVMSSYFRSRRYAGSKDRRAVKNSVFNIIRHRARLDWWLSSALGNMEPTARLRALASILILDKKKPEEIKSLFFDAPYSPGHLTLKEKELINSLAGKALHHQAMPIGVIYEVPEWIDKILQNQWGESYQIEMRELNGIAPVDVRVNTGRVSRNQAQKSLRINDIKTEPTNFSPIGLRLNERADLEKTKAFKKGLIEIQDEGSQLVALLCEAKPGMKVIDYCAGAGGKTLALANCMALQGIKINNGSLIACDVSQKRLSCVDDRLRRAGVHKIDKLVLDSIGATKKLEGSADRVLVDVPCSGTGSWRRHPESRWKLTRPLLDKYIAEQKKILTASAGLIKRGGRLIYSTCSLLEQENQRQIATFLEEHPDFILLPIKEIWARCVKTKCPTENKDLLLSPATTNTDGFYCAVMERRRL